MSHTREENLSINDSDSTSSLNGAITGLGQMLHAIDDPLVPIITSAVKLKAGLAIAITPLIVGCIQLPILLAEWWEAVHEAREGQEEYEEATKDPAKHDVMLLAATKTVTHTLRSVWLSIGGIVALYLIVGGALVLAGTVASAVLMTSLLVLPTIPAFLFALSAFSTLPGLYEEWTHYDKNIEELSLEQYDLHTRITVLKNMRVNNKSIHDSSLISRDIKALRAQQKENAIKLGASIENKNRVLENIFLRSVETIGACLVAAGFIAAAIGGLGIATMGALPTALMIAGGIVCLTVKIIEHREDIKSGLKKLATGICNLASSFVNLFDFSCKNKLAPTPEATPSNAKEFSGTRTKLLRTLPYQENVRCPQEDVTKKTFTLFIPSRPIPIRQPESVHDQRFEHIPSPTLRFGYTK